MKECRLDRQIDDIIASIGEIPKTLTLINFREYVKTYVEPFNSIDILMHAKDDDYRDLRYGITWIDVDASPVITACTGSWYCQPRAINDDVEDFISQIKLYGKSMVNIVFNHKSPKSTEDYAKKQLIDFDSKDCLNEFLKSICINLQEIDCPEDSFLRHIAIYKNIEDDTVLMTYFPNLQCIYDYKAWLHLAEYLFNENDGRYIAAVSNALQVKVMTRETTHALVDARELLKWFRHLKSQYQRTLFKGLDILVVTYESALREELMKCEKLLADGILMPIPHYNGE